MISRRQFVKAFGVAAVGSFSSGGYALAEPWTTGVTHYRISPPRWPSGLKLRLAVIADLHVCEPWMGMDRVRSIVGRTNALEADCVLLLGDYVSSLHMARFSEPVPQKTWAKALGALKAPYGVHAVLGNHDWWEDAEACRRQAELPRVALALQDAGIPVYENAGVRLEKDGIGFWLCGLGDQWAFMARNWRQRGKFKPGTGTDDLAGTLSLVTDAAPVILMAHEPDVFAQMSDRVALTVSGHTHGGQVRILGFAPVVPSRFGDRYVYGHVVEQGRNLVVSGGLGCSGVPIRLGSPPEIVVIDLSA